MEATGQDVVSNLSIDLNHKEKESNLNRYSPPPPPKNPKLVDTMATY